MLAAPEMGALAAGAGLLSLALLAGRNISGSVFATNVPLPRRDTTYPSASNCS
jgi:hypothetical protein